MSGGITAIGVLLILVTALAVLAGVTLVHPGTALDHAWSLNPEAFRQMTLLGPSVGVAFLLLAATLAVAALGWLRRTWWGWLMTLAVLLTQLLGDFFNLLRGTYLRSAVGMLVAAALLAYVVHLRPLFSSRSA